MRQIIDSELGPLRGLSIHLMMLFFSPALLSCDPNESIMEQAPPRTEFSIPAHRYSTNHYFVDTSYVPLYEQYYGNDIPLIDVSKRIIEAELWVDRLGLSQSEDIIAVTDISLPTRPFDGYDASYQSPVDVPGVSETGRFRKLLWSEYCIEGDGYLGIASLTTVMQDNQAIAIAYRREDGLQFGDFVRDLTDTTVQFAVLKLVKPRNLLSQGRGYSLAWNMLVKSMYSIGITNIQQEGFYLNIHRILPTSALSPNILGHSLLRVLGLDRYDANGVRVPDGDGTFDFRLKLTINQSTGEIIFPYLRPFDDGIKDYFVSRGLPLPDSSYYFPAVYDTTQTGAINSSRNQYTIEGSFLPLIR